MNYTDTTYGVHTGCGDTSTMELYDQLLEHITSALNSDEMSKLGSRLDGIMDIALQQVAEDLHAYASRDPASKGRTDLILAAYASFRAVLFHRVAHQVWQAYDMLGRETIAHRLASVGKLQSGVEIHPAASIGRRFVLDHGFGTVIGETCEIGDDCYLLCGVTLGASGIADNHGGKRHPRLGNRVEVGAGARVLGPVSIGDNVFISPSCVITRDVPANTRVSIVNQLQLQRDNLSIGRGFVGAFALSERLHLVGELPDKEKVFVLDADHRCLASLTLECTIRERHHRQYYLRNLNAEAPEPCYPLSLRVMGPAQDIVLLDPPGLSNLVRSVLRPHILTVGG